MTSVLCPPLTFQGVGFGGEPLPFGYLYSYIAGTATPQATWTDSTQVQQNLNPVKLNVNGQAPVWLDPTLTYKFKLTDALGNQVYTTDQVQGSLTAAALSVLLTQSLIGGILYPPIAAEGISVVQPWFPYACIDRYVVNETPGTTPITVGIRAALNAFNYCTFGEGPYLWDSTIALAGNQSLIGLSGGAISAFLTSVVHSALSSGPMISATTTDFGSVYVGNFDISGGNGSYCIVSTRPQSLYENLHMEGASGYNGSGVQLSAASQGSWEVTLRNIKYVASNSAGSPVANAFRGFQVSVNGGNTRLDHCNATYSSVGAEILQGQCITLTHCDFNSCGVNASDSASAGQCGIRLGGTSYKQAISIFECWLEGCVTSIWLETCNNVDIKDCFFDDLGNTNTPAIYLASAAAQNVKIDTNWIQVRNSNSTLACISNAGTSTIITNNTFNASNAGGAQYTIINTVPCVLLNNQNASTNHGTLLDSSGLIQDITPVSGSWTPTLAGSATAGTQTYSLNTGYYWMIGRRVFFDFVIIMTAKDGTTAGNLQINGLPFACRSNAAGRVYSCIIAEHSNLTFVAGSQIGGTLNNNASSITLFQSATGGAVAALTAAALNNTTAVYGSGSYDT